MPRERDRIALLNAIEKAKINNKKLEAQFWVNLKEGLEKIAKFSIKEWYSSYPPHVYRRNYSFWDAYKIRIVPSKGKYSIDFDPSYLSSSHHQSNEWVYQNSFIEGYHGGDTIGEGHPDPGTPYWRYPTPYFIGWYLEPAPYSKSPYEYMCELIPKYVDHLSEQFDEDFDEKIIKKIRKALNRWKGGR